MVYNWPAEVKAFYMKRDPNDEKYVKGVDVLAPEGYGEIVGGAERQDNIDFLIERINNEGLPMEAFQWVRPAQIRYCSARRFWSGSQRFVIGSPASSTFVNPFRSSRFYGRSRPPMRELAN